jgi:hypothetical protein
LISASRRRFKVATPANLRVAQRVPEVRRRLHTELRLESAQGDAVHSALSPQAGIVRPLCGEGGRSYSLCICRYMIWSLICANSHGCGSDVLSSAVPPPDPIHLQGCGAFGSSFVEFQPCAGKPSACLCWASGRGPVSWCALLETLVPVACLCWASGRGLSLSRILVLVPNACLCWASGRGPHLMLSCCLLRPEME